MTLTPEERVTNDLIAPEEVLESERGSLVTGMVIARAWRDAEYRDRLLSRPSEVLVAAGLHIPDGVGVRVFEDTPQIRHVALTSLTSEPAELLPLLREQLPLPEGSELRLIQNTGQAVCLVVPLAPAEPELFTDVEKLRRLAPRASVFASGDVVQSMAEAFGASEAALVGAAEVSAQSSASVFSSASAESSASTESSASASAASAAWLANTEAVVNDVAAVNFADVALAGFEAEAASTTTTVFAETQVGAITFAAALTHTVTFGAEAEAVATTTTAAAEAEAAAVEAAAAATTVAVATEEAEAVATTTTLVAEAEVAAVEAEAAATTTTAAAEAEVAAVEVEAAATTTTVAAEAEAVAVVAIVLT